MQSTNFDLDFEGIDEFDSDVGRNDRLKGICCFEMMVRQVRKSLVREVSWSRKSVGAR